MKKTMIGAALALLAVNGSAEFMIGDNDRFAIYGDSITAGVWTQAYPRYLETYVRTRHPGWKGDAWNFGLIGDTAGNIQRMRRECLPMLPTVMTFNMGMNDSRVDGDFSSSLSNYVAKIRAMVTEVRAKLPEIKIALCSAIPFEDRVHLTHSQKTAALAAFARAERKLAKELGVKFIDINRTYGEAISGSELGYVGTTHFTTDGVHPSVQGGHFMLAVAFIEGLGAEPFLAAAELDATTAKLITARDVEVDGVKATSNGLAFRRRLAHLPFPAVNYLASQELVYADRAVYNHFRIGERLNEDTVKITGLAAGNYDVKIDGVTYGTYAAWEFADGVNFGDFCTSPDFEQACRLSDAVGVKQCAQSVLLYSELAKKPDAAKVEANRKALAEASAAIGKVDRATWHHIEIVRTERPFNAWNREQNAVGIHPVWGERHGGSHVLGGVSGLLVANAAGCFRGKYTVKIENYSDRARKVELSAPAGFSPIGRAFVMAPHAVTNLTFAYDLPAEVELVELKMKHYRADLLGIPTVVTMPFTLSRSAAFRPDRRGVRKLELDMPLLSEGERSRWLGPADFSAHAKLVHEHNTIKLNVRVLDQDHVNGFTGEYASWDDSLSMRIGTKGYTLALAKGGKTLVMPTNDLEKLRYSVVRNELDGITDYRIEFPFTPATNAIPFSLRVVDRESNQAIRKSVWSGMLHFGLPNLVEIADDGIPGVVVVDNGFREASTMLTNYIEKISGTLLPVVSNRTLAAGMPVLELKLGDVKRDPKDTDWTYRQSYRIYRSGRDIIFQSPDPCGLGYSVAGFLQEVLGCRFYTDDFEVVPKKPYLTIAKLDHYDKPSFQMRGGVWGITMSGKRGQWNRKNRCGGLPYSSVNTNHSFDRWVAKAAGAKNASEAYKQHPEWFSMNRNGKREYNWNFGICGTNPAFGDALGKALIAELDAKAEKLAKKGRKLSVGDFYFSIAQGDGFAPCYCPECRKLVKEQDTEAAPQYAVFNRALAVAKRKYPETTICTYAYFHTLIPPKTMKLDDNIYVVIVSSAMSMNQSGDQFNGICEVPANRHYERACREWPKKLAPGHVSTYHWDGVDGGNSEYSEWPNVIAHAKDIQFWHDCGIGCAQKAGGPRPNWGWLTHWLWYSLMWNANQDPWKLTDQFLADYYGPRAGKVYSDYFRYIEKVRQDSGYGCPTVRWSSWAPILLDKVFTYDVRAKIENYMDYAIYQAGHDRNPEYRKRCLLAKATTIDELNLNAAKRLPYALVNDKASGKLWAVHGKDPKNPGRVMRLGDYAAANPAYWTPEQMRSFSVQNSGSEAYVLRSGELEAVVTPDLKGRVLSLKSGGTEVFANDGDWRCGYADLFNGWSKAWKVTTNAAPNSLSVFCNIGVAEWCNGYNDHWFYRTTEAKDGELVIRRSYAQPDCTRRTRYASRFTSRYSLIMPSAAEALVGVVGGGVKQVVSLAGADKATASAKNTKRAADRLAADCQNPLFDVLEEVAASGDVTIPLTSHDGKLSIAYTRGDGIAVEIETTAKGWEKVVVKPDAKHGVCTLELVGENFDGKKNETAVALTNALPVEIVRVKGKVTKPIAPKAVVTTKGALKVKKLDENHAINLADGAEMIRIPAGKFWRGSKTGPNDEQPQRQIELSEFWIYKEPVTLCMYTNNLARVQPEAKFEWCWGQGMMLDRNVSASGYPVLCGWNEAEAYARSVGGELPTEAQWEKAARGDKDARVYPWGDKWDGTKSVGWEMTLEGMHDEGIFPSGRCPGGNSPYGLVDMAGNNFEWVRDWYGHDYYKTAPAKDPKGPSTGVNKVLRGGDSCFSEDFHRCSARFLCDPTRRDCVKVTFRVVVEGPIK